MNIIPDQRKKIIILLLLYTRQNREKKIIHFDKNNIFDGIQNCHLIDFQSHIIIIIMVNVVSVCSTHALTHTHTNFSFQILYPVVVCLKLFLTNSMMKLLFCIPKFDYYFGPTKQNSVLQTNKTNTKHQ